MNRDSWRSSRTGSCCASTCHGPVSWVSERAGARKGATSRKTVRIRHFTLAKDLGLIPAMAGESRSSRREDVLGLRPDVGEAVAEQVAGPVQGRPQVALLAGRDLLARIDEPAQVGERADHGCPVPATGSHECRL